MTQQSVASIRGFLILLGFAVGVGGRAFAQALPDIPPEQMRQIEQACPAAAPAKPAAARHLLVFTLTRGFRHSSIPTGVHALRLLGEKSGAFRITHSEDPAVFEADSLRRFDAVCFLNTTGELFTPADFEKLSPAEQAAAGAREKLLKDALLEFITQGKGFVGIHAATDTFYKWPEFGALIGGYFDGHPWHEAVTIQNCDPQHPLNAALAGADLEIADEIYQIRDPYDRAKQRVLTRLDTQRTNMQRDGIHRKDGDFPVSWVKSAGKGRAFYCSLGHREEIYWNPKVLGLYLAGIQYALGDLPADAAPIAAPAPRKASAEPPAASPPPGFTALFNGSDLTGWQGLVADPSKRAAMTAEQRALAQRDADAKMRAHWRVRDGVLHYDGGGDSLCTTRDYGDFELLVDWKIEAGGDSGVYLRGSPQVQIWDAEQHPEGSGGLYNNEKNPKNPLVKADRPVGEWNTFRIRMVGERVTVHLNGTLVVDDVVLENYWEREKPIYARGPIELQNHGNKLQFRNLFIREIAGSAAAPSAGSAARGPMADDPAPTGQDPASRPAQGEWRELFNGRDLNGWTCKPGSWKVEDGTIARAAGGDFLWSTEQFGDFVLTAEFKLSPKGNSGIFIRTASQQEWLHTGIEIQVLDSHGKEKPDKHDCGAVYDCVAPRVNACRPTGEWNRCEITCRGPRIEVVLNGEKIVEMNLDDWKDAGKNPDGTPNKFKTAYRDMARRGFIGFQDHGNPVWYRNVRIKALAAKE